MNGVRELDNNFVFPEFFSIEELMNLPIYKHIYGQPQENNPKTLFWTEYQPSSPELIGTGSISFVRRLYVKYPKVANYVTDYLQTLFPIIKFDIGRVSIFKTKGTVGKHMDEAGRICCVNIGIKNAASAITRTSVTKDFKLFDKVASEIICQDNHAYLLDTSSVHEVVGLDLTTDRLFFSYAFGRDFNTINSCYKKDVL